MRKSAAKSGREERSTAAARGGKESRRPVAKDQRRACFPGRILLLGICLLLFTAGCGGTLKGDDSRDEIETIVMTYQTYIDSRTEGLPEVVEAINAISREEIGVEISLRLVDAVESASLYPVWLSQGEKVDLMVLNYVDITGYVSPGYLLPLDDLLEKYGQGILALKEADVNVTSGAVIDGKTYGIYPRSVSRGSGGGLWIPVRYLREVNFDYDPDRIYTMEELDQLFADLKELHPDSFPLGQITTGRTFSSFTFFYGSDKWIACADSIDSGVTKEDVDRFENFYETGEYREFLSWLRRWYQAGFIYPDAATTTLSAMELLRSGTVLSIPMSSMPQMLSDDTAGEEIVCLETSRITYGPDNSATGIRWVIPQSSENPEAAMKFLNLMFTDDRIVNLFAWGIEGRDYVVTDQEKRLIAFPEGDAPEQLSYYNPLGLYGDLSLRYELETDQLTLQQIAYSEKAVPVGMKYADFTFDASGCSVEKEMVGQVLRRYLPVLESGSVDLDSVYPAFLSALQDAGMQRLLSEKQRQLDAFLSGREGD